MTAKFKVKVCGMRDSENISQLIKVEPDFIGFILFPGSKRYIGNNYSLEVDIPQKIQKVGVFVNAVIRDVIHWKNRLELDFVQLHGLESPEYCKEISGMGLKVIKTFGVDRNFDFSLLNDFTPFCNYFLFDTISPTYGGSGKKFDWSVLKNYSLEIPVFLSGGIGPEDAENLTGSCFENLNAIDLNSRFEISPGLKDIDLIREFINKIRFKQQLI